jgi:hypothetical protein
MKIMWLTIILPLAVSGQTKTKQHLSLITSLLLNMESSAAEPRSTSNDQLQLWVQHVKNENMQMCCVLTRLPANCFLLF